MLPLAMAAILEKNKVWQQSAWLTLLEIQDSRVDGGCIPLVCSNRNVIWGGREWIAFPFDIPSVKQSKTELPKVPVKISNLSGVIEQYIEQFDGFIGDTGILRIINTAGATEDENGKIIVTTDAVVEETFAVHSVSSDAIWATFNLGGALPVMQRFPIRRILKDFCPFEFGKIECGYSGTGFTTCPRTLQGCRERGNSVRFGGEPAIGYGGIYASNS